MLKIVGKDGQGRPVAGRDEPGDDDEPPLTVGQTRTL